MITKGLAGLLAMGLSGNPPEAIQTVKPEFIQVAGLQASLTAGYARMASLTVCPEHVTTPRASICRAMLITGVRC